MDRKRNEKQYTTNPDTGRRIVVNGPTWRRLSTKYYTNNDGSFTASTNDSYPFWLVQMNGTNVISNTSGMVMNLEQSANNDCPSSWTL